MLGRKIFKSPAAVRLRSASEALPGRLRACGPLAVRFRVRIAQASLAGVPPLYPLTFGAPVPTLFSRWSGLMTVPGKSCLLDL